MLWIACILVVFTAGISIKSVLECKKRKAWRKQNIVYLPSALAFAGMICGVILFVPTIVCALDTDSLFYLFGGAMLICDGMMLAYLNCVISYDHRGFIAGNLLGIRKAYAYEDVLGLRTGKDVWVYCKNHRILLDEIAIGKEQFVDAIDKGYRQATGRWTPLISRRWDPMKGNLDHPWAYFVVFVALMLFALILPIMYYYSMNVETDPKVLQYHDVFIMDCQEQEGELVFYTQDPEITYKLSYWEDYEDFWTESQPTNKGKNFRIGTKGDHSYICYLADEEGNIFVTPERERQVYRENQRPFGVFLWVLSPSLLWVGYMGIAVGRNPDRYPKWLRRLFYKDSVFI